VVGRDSAGAGGRAGGIYGAAAECRAEWISDGRLSVGSRGAGDGEVEQGGGTGERAGMGAGRGASGVCVAGGRGEGAG